MKKSRIELRFNLSQKSKVHRCKKIRLVPPAQRCAAEPTPRRRGAPLGNKNALKHGRFTREMKALRAEIRAHIYRSRALVRQLLAARSDRI